MNLLPTHLAVRLDHWEKERKGKERKGKERRKKGKERKERKERKKGKKKEEGKKCSARIKTWVVCALRGLSFHRYYA